MEQSMCSLVREHGQGRLKPVPDAGRALRSSLPFGVSGISSSRTKSTGPCSRAVVPAEAGGVPANSDSPSLCLDAHPERHVGDQLFVSRLVLAQRRGVAATPRLRPAQPRSRRVRSGSRGASPAGRPAPGTRSRRPAATAPGRLSGTAAPRRATNGSGTNRSAVRSPRSDTPALAPLRRCRAPRDALRHRLHPRAQHVDLRVRDGLPS